MTAFRIEFRNIIRMKFRTYNAQFLRSPGPAASLLTASFAHKTQKHLFRCQIPRFSALDRPFRGRCFFYLMPI